MRVYSGFKSYHYFNACACALCGILISACPRSASHNSVNTYQNENRFLAFGSLTSNAEVEITMISVCIIVCSKFSGILLLRFFFCSVYKASRYFVVWILMRFFKLEKYHQKVKGVYQQSCLYHC